MATKAETQAYFDAVKVPTILAPGGAGGMAQSSRAFAGKAGLFMQQVAVWETLLQQSEVVETDAELVALYEEHTQSLGALRRELMKHHQASRALHNIMGRMKVADAEMRVKAAVAGYTT